MRDHDARRELADFLKKRRERTSPEAFGFACLPRRRTLGLRREEVAAVAGVGLTWYTRLEQGKEIQVSAAFLDNLARALKLSEAERFHLFALAQHRLPPLAQPIPSTDAPAGLQSILDVIDSPAYARNNRFDVVAWNSANTMMFGDFAAIPAVERNVIWLMFVRGYHRRTMPDWEADARGLLAKFRLSFGQAADAAAFLPLISALTEVSGDFRRMWADHEVSDVGEGVTEFRSPRHGIRLFHHHVMVPESRPELRIIVYVAGEGVTFQTPAARSPPP